ncbi:hypothetical protein ACFL2G_00730 [Candidatus Omnitrophota bacterium]
MLPAFEVSKQYERNGLGQILLAKLCETSMNDSDIGDIIVLAEGLSPIGRDYFRSKTKTETTGFTIEKGGKERACNRVVDRIEAERLLKLALSRQDESNRLEKVINRKVTSKTIDFNL